MTETQNIEYKSSWRDEYLKWICGFSNAGGGRIFIGKNDAGKVIGVADAKTLMEEIPNKVRDVLGIIVDVNLHETTDGDYIEIVVEAYPNAVNYKGQYYYRSGTTKQELKGAALDKFLLQKKGKRWDAAPIPHVSVKDLKKETFDFFRKRGLKNQRLTEDALTNSNQDLLENLKLTEGNYLKRAAILLFHPDPEKFVTGAYIKIGYFESDSDLRFQDEVHGNLFEQAEKTIEILFTKYFRAFISYHGIHREETFEYPQDAVREALLNAIAHKDYSGGTPIQISVYKNKLMIWNEGQLPENWTLENLLAKHPSIPYNPDIANAFFRGGYIEAWGSGFRKMTKLCLEAGVPKPQYYYQTSGFWVDFRTDIYHMDYLQSLGLNQRQIKAVLYTVEHGKISNSEYQKLNDVSKRTATSDLSELVENFEALEKIGTSGSNIFYKVSGAIVGQKRQ